MRLLVLGGTKFLGRAAVEAALEQGHEVTLFNRGQTNTELFPEAKHLRGDRDGGLEALRGHGWDAVIDPSGFVPRLVRASAEFLRDAVAHYVFVSSISVYDDGLEPDYAESAPTVILDDPSREDFRTQGEVNTYGGLKVLCEQVLADVFPGAHASVRAGLIVGPNDPTGRFTYWPLRVAAGGDVLAPGEPGRRVQLVDVRDLGAWLVHLAEQRISGTFNSACPAMTMEALLAACREAAESDASFVWVDEKFLAEHGVGQWLELPLWLHEADNAFLEADVSLAAAAGLCCRPLAETARDTLAWARGHGCGLVSETEYGAAGMKPGREAELLEAWKASVG